MSNWLNERERLLASYAFKSAASEGRSYPEEVQDERLCFQKDKDRIIHSKAFRRLDQKTQVFVAGTGDHYRTRLTHTLEVAQISRDIARRLQINEDLCEAIALAHDLGHPPFGHAGEQALDEVMRKHGSHFEHNEQSRRVVEVLERAYPNFPGLNLTHEVLEGMIKHQSAFDQAGKQFDLTAHLEAQVVNLADEIAYTNHDMDDGLRSGIISLKDLRRYELWQKGEQAAKDEYGNEMDEDILISRSISKIISMMIDDLCTETENTIAENTIKTFEDVKNFKGQLVLFSSAMGSMLQEIRHFLYNNFYMNPKVLDFMERGKKVVINLFQFYLDHPEKFSRGKNSPENIKDYIAGMTDNFIMQTYDLSQV